MIPLPDTELGSLRIIEVFDYCDFPRLFSCENHAGQKYLALSVEDTLETHVFLYLPLSIYRYSLLVRGELSIREAYSNSEDGRVYKVEISPEASLVSSMDASAIPDRWLPDFECLIEATEEIVFERKHTVLPAFQVAASGK